jgi:hypothetical protein
MLLFGLCLLGLWIQLLVLGVAVLGRRRVESEKTKHQSKAPCASV